MPIAASGSGSPRRVWSVPGSVSMTKLAKYVPAASLITVSVNLSEEQLRDLIHSVLRRTFGEEPANRLRIPAPAKAELMPLISMLNRQAGYWQKSSTALGRGSPPPGDRGSWSGTDRRRPALRHRLPAVRGSRSPDATERSTPCSRPGRARRSRTRW